MKNLEAGEFWGKSCGASYSLPTKPCLQTCSKYRFWIRVDVNVEVCES